MPSTYNVMIMGASYGSLLATKLLFAGHKVKLVCLPSEAELINQEGTRVRLPIKGKSEQVEIDSRKLPGQLSADVPTAVNPSDYDLVALAMQEPQYRAAGVRELLAAVAKDRVPCMSIMNMPPLPYLKRIPGLNADSLRACYTDPSVWEGFEPGLLTLCSPDHRPSVLEEKSNVLMVTLPTSFRLPVSTPTSTTMLRQVWQDIEAVRFDAGDGPVDIPVKLKVHDSIYVPLAKWAMLLTGNYRCVTKDAAVTIKEAVHADVEKSRTVYNWVRDLVVALGADPNDLRRCRSRNTPLPPTDCRGRRQRRAPCLPARRISNAPIAWCRLSAPRRACGRRSSMRRWRLWMPGSRSTVRRPRSG